MEWNRETILHFINLIKKRPAIWDFHAPEYKMKRKRLEAIEEVALLMGVVPKEVSTKWIILRNQYSREKRKITETGIDTPYVSKWYAYKEMDALMRNKSIGRNFWTQESKSDGEDSSSSSPPQPAPKPSGIQNIKTIDTTAQDSLTIYSEAIKTLKHIRETQTNDELTNYGLYIAAHLRKYSAPLQSRAKYEINKLLYAIDLESISEYSIPIPNDNNESILKELKVDPLQSQRDE